MSGFPCRAPWDGAVIHFSGAVYPCNNISQGEEMAQMRLGHLKEASLIDILNGEKARSLRHRLLMGDTQGLLCESCDKAQTCNPYGDPQFGKEGQLIHGGAELQAVLPDLNPMPFKRLELGLTDLCNMNCIMCCLSWGEASPKAEPQRGMMSKDILDELILQLPDAMATEFVVWLHWIGEPLIHPHIDEVCQKLDSLGATIHLVTNGIQLTPKRQMKLLALSGRHTLNISLNALDPVVFERVNQSKQFARVMAHTHQFLEQSMRQNRWNIVLSAVILRENWKDVIEMTRYWTSQIVNYGGVPSIVVNGKPDPSREITQYQIALLREVAQPSAAVYFRMVLRACLPDISSWDLTFWDAYDTALVCSDSISIVEAMKGFSYEEEQKSIDILLDHCSHDLSFAGELIGLVSEAHHDAILNVLVEGNAIFSNSKPELSLSALRPSARLNLARCFPRWRQGVLQTLQDSTQWGQHMVEALALWIVHEPSLSNDGFPLLEPTETMSGVLVRFWQGDTGLSIPPITDVTILNGFSGIISLRDRPNWGVSVAPQPICIIQARLLEALDGANWPNCIDKISGNSNAPPWLWRALRRRILFSGFKYGEGKPLLQSKLSLSSETWEYWLLLILMGMNWNVPDLLSIGEYSDIAFSDLAEVVSVIDTTKDKREELVAWCRQTLSCPALTLNAQKMFGLIRIWEVCSDGTEWSQYLRRLQMAHLESWQLHIVARLQEPLL